MEVRWHEGASMQLHTGEISDAKGEGNVMLLSLGRTRSRLPGTPRGRSGGRSVSIRAFPS